jgi:ribosome biogenesis protein UTP30
MVKGLSDEELSKSISEEVYESDMVKLKKVNQKLMTKSIQKASGNVKAKVDMKGVVSAIKALQQSASKKKKNALFDEDANVFVNVTMT